MRGFPPIEMLLIALLFVVAAFPLLRLTGEGAAGQAVDAPLGAVSGAMGEGNGRAVFATARFAHPPVSLVILDGGREVFAAGDGDRREFDVEFESGSAGADLTLRVRWPEGSPESAVELVLEPDLRDAQSKTFWGESELEALWSPAWRES